MSKFENRRFRAIFFSLVLKWFQHATMIENNWVRVTPQYIACMTKKMHVSLNKIKSPWGGAGVQRLTKFVLYLKSFFQDNRWSYSVEYLDLGNTRREMENWVTDLSVISMEVIINIRDVEAISPRKWEKWQRSPRKTIEQGRRRGPLQRKWDEREQELGYPGDSV